MYRLEYVIHDGIEVDVCTRLTVCYIIEVMKSDIKCMYDTGTCTCML